VARIDPGDLVLLREDAFECLEDDCSELKGQLGEVVYISSVLEGAELTILYKGQKRLIHSVPQTFVYHVAQA
jgi:hypothetical protein